MQTPSAYVVHSKRRPVLPAGSSCKRQIKNPNYMQETLQTFPFKVFPTTGTLKPGHQTAAGEQAASK